MTKIFAVLAPLLIEALIKLLTETVVPAVLKWLVEYGCYTGDRKGASQWIVDRPEGHETFLVIDINKESLEKVKESIN